MSSASEAIQSSVVEKRRMEAESPIKLMRIIKNDVEIKGMREAHELDGAAIIKYLYELDKGIDDQTITELKGIELLNNFKK